MWVAINSKWDMTNAIVQFVQLPIIFTQKQSATGSRFFPLSIRMLLAASLNLFQNSDKCSIGRIFKSMIVFLPWSFSWNYLWSSSQKKNTLILSFINSFKKSFRAKIHVFDGTFVAVLKKRVCIRSLQKTCWVQASK